jgi:hypothetical protein
MSEEEIVGDSFEVAQKKLEEAYEAAVVEVSAKAEKAKSEALRKLQP